MKRILRSGICASLCVLSVFFTGCKGETIPSYRSMPLYDQEEKAPVPTTEAETKPPFVMPDVEEEAGKVAYQVMEERFRDVTGPKAFYMPRNHSAAQGDLKAFDVLGLVDGWIYYSYVTLDRTTGQEVRAAMAYNYRERIYKRLYEGPGDSAQREGSGQAALAPFNCHLYKSSKGGIEIAVYDDGKLSLRRNTDMGEDSSHPANLIFERGREDGGEDFRYLVREIFGVGGEKPEYYDMDITSMTADGLGGFHVSVTLYKNDYTQIGNVSEEEAENAMDIKECVLTYSYAPTKPAYLSSSRSKRMYQEDLNWENRVRFWKEQGEKNTGSLRNPRSDWNDLKEKGLLKLVWGPYYVAEGYSSLPAKKLGVLWRWKDKRSKNFVEGKAGVSYKEAAQEGAVQVRTPYISMVENVMTLNDDQRLEGYFFMTGQDYCPIIGAVEKPVNTINENITRTCYYKVIDENGEPGIDSEEQSIWVERRHVADFTEGSGTETFRVLETPGMELIPGPVESDLDYTIGVYVKNMLLQVMRPSAKREEDKLAAQVLLTEGSNTVTQILGAGEGSFCAGVWDVESGKLCVRFSDNTNIQLSDRDLNPSGYSIGESDKVFLEELEKRNQESKKESASKESASEENKYGFSENVYNNPDRYEAGNIVVLGSKKDRKLLFITFYNGILLFEGDGMYGLPGQTITSGVMYHISEWPLYCGWKTGDKEITAIGFDRVDDAYSYMDIAQARVYTFNMEGWTETADAYRVPVGEDGRIEAVIKNGVVTKPMDGGTAAGSFQENKLPHGLGGADTPTYAPEIEEDVGEIIEKRKKAEEESSTQATEEENPPVEEYELTVPTQVHETDAMTGQMWDELSNTRRSKKKD